MSKIKNADLEIYLDKILNGYLVTKEDIFLIMNCDLEKLEEMARAIRNKFIGKKFDLCTIINGKSGKCSENCKFCAQSSHYSTGVEEYGLLDKDTILENAIQNYNNGVNRFSIVTSGRKLSKAELEHISEAYDLIRNNCDIKLCSSNGLLDYDDFVKLKESGVSRYHNNLETSRSFFPAICTSHTYDDKIKAIIDAKKAGLEVCSGGIFGMGENLEDRIDMAFTLRELKVDSIPLNMLNPIKNTPLENMPIMSYSEYRRSIALFRIILPSTSIRLAGGRGLLEDKGRAAINAGVDSMISGDMLTTDGINTKTDLEMIKDII